MKSNTISHNTSLQTQRAIVAYQHYTVSEAACQTVLDYYHATQNPEFCEANNITVEQLKNDMIVLAARWADSRLLEPSD